MKGLKGVVKHGTGKRIGSAILAMVLAVTYMPFSAAAVYADETEATVAYLVNDDGTETLISQEELEELREESFSEVPEEIDVVLGDDQSEPDSVYTDDAQEEGLFLISEDEDAELEESGIEDLDVLEAAGTDSADEETEASAEDLNTDEEEDWEDSAPGTGNVEVFTDPVLMEKMGIVPVGETADPEGLIQAADATVDAVYAYSGTVPASAYNNISINQSGATVTVSGSLASGYYFVSLGVDFNPAYSYSLSSRYSSCPNTINMNNYDTGYHTVVMGISNSTGSKSCVIGRKFMVSNTITAAPGYNGVFEVYSSYFNYYPYDMAGNNAAGSLYMEYSSDGGRSWNRSGAMTRNWIKLFIQQGFSISGLKPKTTYLTRIFYGTYATYSTSAGGDGNAYFFSGPALGTTTFKTGSSSKPSIKSVTAKAIKVKYHKVRHYGYYTGVYLYTEKFYTCKIKVTVKLKKKPGTKGLFINGAWVKGNKKPYTKTFTPYPNYYAKRPRGHYKYTVTVCSGQNSSWGGYSPAVSKTKKLS